MNGIEKARGILENYAGPDCRIMEVCGTHTHEIFRQGIRRILSPKIHLISARRANEKERRIYYGNI